MDIRIFFAFFALASVTGASVSGYIDKNDEKRLMERLTAAFIKPHERDVSSGYYATVGYELLKQGLVKVLKMDTCYHLETNFKKEATPDDAFHALATWNKVKCDGKLHTEATVKILKDTLESDKSTISEIRYALEALQELKQTISNPARVSQLLQARLKEDDSLSNLAHALHAARALGPPHSNFMLSRVEDVVAQADEIDGKLLQWEGGLTVSSALITGLLRLPGLKSSPFDQTQINKLANYLMTRKTVQSARGIVALVDACIALSDNSIAPVSITAATLSVSSEKPDLIIKVTDLLGRPLKAAPGPIIAQTATRVSDDVVVLSKQPFSPGSNPTDFTLPLRLEPGVYRLSVSAGSHSASLTVKVTGPFTVKSVEIGLGDADGATPPKYTSLTQPAKLTQPLQADGASQHLFVKFNVNKPVHQAFLRLYTAKREIVFIAEKDSAQVYKIEVNLASELSSSDTFDMELIIGDAVMSNPLKWNLGVIEVKLPAAESKSLPTKGPKPEIEHMFRPAEKRPPQVVSLLFTGLAAAPMLLLFILWFKIGLNLKNFTLTALPFHLGLAAILGLYVLFWLRLDMFTTAGWLIPIGGFTFLAGNKLLRKIAKEKKH